MAGSVAVKEAVVAANRVDDLILRHIDSHSPEVISQMLGGAVTPARIRLRAQELVRSVDWMTDAEQDNLVTLKLRRILAELEGKILDVDNAKLRLVYLKEIGVRLEKRRAATEGDLNQLYRNQAQIMVEALQELLVQVFKELRAAHPDIAEAEVRQISRAALPAAVVVVNERNVGDVAEVPA